MRRAISSTGDSLRRRFAPLGRFLPAYNAKGDTLVEDQGELGSFMNGEESGARGEVSHPTFGPSSRSSRRVRSLKLVAEVTT